MVDIGENSGLRVICGTKGIKTFFYRYRSPINNKLKQLTLGIYVHSVKDENLEPPLGKKKLGLASAMKIETINSNAKNLTDYDKIASRITVLQAEVKERININTDKKKLWLIDIIERSLSEDNYSANDAILAIAELNKMDGDYTPIKNGVLQ
ncbi:MAG: DUF4102 domain-containing protein [Proteobacteria bacterium]|nr:DUF4102 domain-containing protein [Pseudomonadota bacterium]